MDSYINKDEHSLSTDLNEILRKHRFEGIIRSKVLGRIRDQISEKGTGGWAPDLGETTDNGGYINAIPSKIKGACHEELLVLCYDEDKLHERLQKMLSHAGILCRGINRKVLFLTSYWLPKKFNEYIEEIEKLRQEGVDIVFVLFTKNGATEIPT